MRINDFLTQDRVRLGVRARGKAPLLAEIARHFAHFDPSLDAPAIEAALLSREQLGSTGLGNGFALPHARIEALGGFQGMFLRLQKPIEFQAIDGAPVVMVFALLMPAADPAAHVAALAAVSRLFRNGGVMEELRQAPSVEAAWEIFARS